MPFINIRLTGQPLAPAQATRLEQEAARILAEVMHKRAEWIVVLVEPTCGATWTIGGHPAGIAAHVQTTINTNGSTPGQKSRYIAETYALLRDVLGSSLPELTYVELKELPGDAWGFGGVSNADRAAAALAR